MMKKQLLLAAAALIGICATAETPRWLRDVRISPDGKQIVFTYKGDLFTVPTNGGEAKRLTTSTSYESTPIWSPDCKQIAYSSDRHGNFDIFVIDADGGNPRRLTTNSAGETPEAFSADGKRVYYTASIQAPAASVAFPTSRNHQLYSIALSGGSSKQEVGYPVAQISFLPDGASFLYQDCKGMENIWRKHHTSSVSKDIWKYDASTGNHTNLTSRPGEDRNPVVANDGKTVYFLSERNGDSFNVYSTTVDDMSVVKKLTNFKTHPVRFLSSSNDGILAFAYDGDIYTMPNGKKASKVAIDVTMDEVPQTEMISVSGRYGVPSADGKQFAYIGRGEVFVGSIEHSSTKQITHTAAAESQVSWNPDNREILYTSMRDGHFNVYSAKIAREDDPNFSNATLIDEKVLIADDDIERTNAQYSPDGKKIAFIQDRNKLMIKDVESGKIKQLTDGSHYKFRYGSYDYQWSPDNKWILLEVGDNMHDPYNDIAIINVDNGEMVHLTRSGYTDARPRFVIGGNAVIFLTERWGMRNHASWGSMDDVAIVFLNQDAYDKYRLSKEDYELLKEVEKQQKKSAKKEEPKNDDKKDKKKDKDNDSESDSADKEDDKSKEIKVEVEGLEDRMLRLTPFSGNIADAWVDNDGRTLYYLLSVEKGYDLWKLKFEDREPSIAVRLDMGAASIYPSTDGKTLYIMGDKMRKYDVGGSSAKAITSSASMRLDHAAEREAMFNQVYISEREMFYHKDMHGVKWDELCNDYRKFLPHINNNYDFAQMLSELLGELNVSHTGSGFRGNKANDISDRTANLGLLYDMTYEGDGLKVAEIVSGGPFDNANTKIQVGCVIKAINGVELKAGEDYSPAFVDIIGRKTLVTIAPADGSDSFDEVILPISSGTMNNLMYKRWIKARAADVDRWSNGRLGYVHIQSMDDGSFRKVYGDLLGKYNKKEGVVVDIRWNGGGRLHEDIEILLSGEKYFTQVVRGQESCDMPSRRYNKPTIMVMAEPCYSNAHGTPWVYSHRGLGKLVGMPVPGTMTSVNWVTLQDPSLYFGIPVVGYRLADGSYLENSQLEPDVKIDNMPEDVVAGEDAQLRKAVEELLKEIDAK